MTIEIPPELEAGLTAVANAAGLSPEEYLRRVLEQEVKMKRGHQPTATHPATQAERYAQLRDEIVATGAPLLDDDELREEIRERRGLKTEPSA